MKKILVIFSLVGLLLGCQKFLDTAPEDALSPDSFWNTEKDAFMALTGCYNVMEYGTNMFYRECATDNAYNFHTHEGWQVVGNGNLSAADPGAGEWDFTAIRRCNELLERIESIEFKDATLKNNYKAEARFIRAYRYFLMTQAYGDVPLFTENFETAQDAMVGRNPREEVEQFIIAELKDIIDNNMLLEHPTGADYGRISKGAAQGLLVRMHLFRKEYTECIQRANEITGYTLFNDGTSLAYNNLFLLSNEINNEVIFDMNHIENTWSLDFTPYYNNNAGGWSSVVPLQSLVDEYELINGETIAEGLASGSYNPANPYFNRDPRLKATVLYSGQLWEGKPYNAIDQNSDTYEGSANNSTHSGYNMKKYFSPMGQYSDITNTGRNIAVIRYAEVLLSLAEAQVETGDLTGATANINLVRVRAGMTLVDVTKYGTAAKLRELVRRERRVELAFEGVRRFDIIRWGVAKDVLNGSIYRCNTGTISATPNAEGDYDVSLTAGTEVLIENRKFTEGVNELLPIPQSAFDKNPNMGANNPGY